MTPLWLLLGCQACSACFKPSLDDINTEDSGEEDEDSPTDSPVDSPIDTTPPPPCPQPEVEPNNNSDAAFPIEMESWACGHFESAFDFDVFTFEMEQGGWLEVDIDAASRGSAAHVLLALENDEGQTVTALRGDTSTDARVVVPVGPGTWTAWLNEFDQEYGDDIDYHLLASSAKQPVSWNRDAETWEPPNQSWDTAMDISDGDVIWGVIDAPTAFDWYVWRSPRDTKKRTLALTVTAMSAGSPLNVRLQRWDLNADGELYANPSKTFDADTDSASQDPSVELSVSDEDVYIKVRHVPGFQTGELYWYTLSVEVY